MFIVTDLICHPLLKVNQIDIFWHPTWLHNNKNYQDKFRQKHGVGDSRLEQRSRNIRNIYFTFTLLSRFASQCSVTLWQVITFRSPKKSYSCIVKFLLETSSEFYGVELPNMFKIYHHQYNLHNSFSWELTIIMWYCGNLDLESEQNRI